MAVPDFLKDDQAEEDGADANDLARLSDLVGMLKETNADIEDLEEKLEALSARRKALAQTEIPDLMRSRGLSEVRLADKTKVIVSEELKVSVPDDKRAAFIAFLEKRQEDDIAKNVFYFPRMPPERLAYIKEFLEANEYEFEAERNVHPQTLKKYFKTILGVGDPDRDEGLKTGKYLAPAAVEDVASVFQYFETKLK